MPNTENSLMKEYIIERDFLMQGMEEKKISLIVKKKKSCKPKNQVDLGLRP